MSDQFPGGAPVSFAGTTFASIVYQLGYPSVTDTPTEAIEATLGLYPVDLYGSAVSPSKRVLTFDALLRANDSSTTPWTDIIGSLNTLRALPWTGSLVVHLDANGSGTLAAPARRSGIPQAISPSNARLLVVKLSFTILGAFV